MTLKQLANLGAVRVLEQTAAVLRERGWMQGAICHRRNRTVDLQGALCLACGVRVGDLTKASDPLTLLPVAQAGAGLAAWDALEGLVGDPVAWNDHPGRTVEDVFILLRNAGDRLTIAV